MKRGKRTIITASVFAFWMGMPASWLPSGVCADDAAAKIESKELAPNLRYKFKDGQKEAYVVRMETGDDTDRLVREGTVTYQFHAPSAIGFSLEIIPEPVRTRRITGSYSMGARELIGNQARLSSGPIKFSSFGDSSQASDSNRTRPIPGDLQSLIIIPLSDKAGRTWTREFKFNMNYPTRNRQFKSSAAVETHTFTIQKIVEKSVAIERTMKVVTNDQSREKPAWELTMKGTLVLDLETGLPLEGEWAGDMTQRDDRGEFRTPFRESFRRLGAEVVKAAAEEEAKTKAHNEKFSSNMARLREFEDKPTALRKTLSREALNKAIVDLKSKDEAVIEKTLEVILAAKPEGSRKIEVLAALEAVKHTDNTFITFGVMQAKREWSEAITAGPGNDNAPRKLSADDIKTMLALIADLSNKSVQKRKAACLALEQYPDARAAKALANALSDGFTRRDATAALRGMGPIAADHVMPLLQSPDVFVTQSVFEVLKVQATAKHVPALEKALLTERDVFRQDDLREVIAAAKGR